jgi:hypothetical protein
VGKECGTNGCGGDCGSCGIAGECNADGKCICPTDGGFEPNNVCSSAVPVTPGTYNDLAICKGGDMDWYSIQLEAGQKLVVNILFTHALGDLDAYLYKQGNCSGYLTASSGSTDNESLKYTSQTKSTFLIRVMGYDDSHANSYMMEISVQ